MGTGGGMLIEDRISWKQNSGGRQARSIEKSEIDEKKQEFQTPIKLPIVSWGWVVKLF